VVGCGTHWETQLTVSVGKVSITVSVMNDGHGKMKGGTDVVEVVESGVESEP
jgi:hypothetical protein